MKIKILFLVNELREFSCIDLVEKYLPSQNFDVSVSTCFPINDQDYLLIVPWNYRKKIRLNESSKNVIVMHSSDLPEGRGFAPIYYTFKNQNNLYTISAIIINENIDMGEVIAKARFPIQDDYTASFIRSIDEEICIRLISRIVQIWPDGKLRTVKQSGEGSFNQKRRPEESEVDVNNKLKDLLPHIRGLEDSNMPFFYINKIKYFIKVWPENKPKKPTHVVFDYPGICLNEKWNMNDSA